MTIKPMNIPYKEFAMINAVEINPSSLIGSINFVARIFRLFPTVPIICADPPADFARKLCNWI